MDHIPIDGWLVYKVSVMKISWILAGLACLCFGQAKAQYLGVQKFTRGEVVLISGDTLRGPLTYYVERDVVIVQPPGQLPQTFTASGVQSFVTNSSSTPVEILSSRAVTQQPNTTTSGLFIPVTGGGIVSQVPTSPTVWRDTITRHQYVALPWPPAIAQKYQAAFGFFELMVLGKATLVQRLRYQEGTEVKYYGSRVGGSESIAALLDNNNRAKHLYREVESADGIATRKQMLLSILYLIGPSGKLQPLLNPRKEVMNLYAKHKLQINKYMQAEKLSWLKAEDVVKIVAYANTI